MKCVILVAILMVGIESLALAYDIPPPPRPEPTNAATGVSIMGAVIGGSLLAAALVVVGLWFSRKRKS